MTNQAAMYLTILAPFVATNVVSIGIFTAIAVKLHVHRVSVNRSGNPTSNGQGRINVTKTAMTLVALFGISELLGVIQTREPTVDDVFSTCTSPLEAREEFSSVYSIYATTMFEGYCKVNSKDSNST